MLIRIYRLDENSQKTLMAELHVDALRLMLVAEDREENTRAGGASGQPAPCPSSPRNY